MSMTKEYIDEAIKKGYYPDKDGNVYSQFQKLKPKMERNGRYSFAMRFCGERIRIYIHQFVAYHKFGDEMFNEGIEVRHLDNNPTNNTWDNIGIGTHSENMMDLPKDVRISRAINASYKARRFPDEVVQQILEDRENGLTYPQLCEKYDTSKSTLSYLFNHAQYSKN